MTDKYFPNGCHVCGADIFFNEKTFTYQCALCGRSANAHRTDTEYSEKYEPYHELSDVRVHKLRHTLNDVFTDIWQKRVEFKRPHNEQTTNDIIINIGYPDNIRITEDRHPQYVKVISPVDELCDVLVLDNNEVVEGIRYSSLKAVSNRSKALVWLAIQLGLPTDNFKIGFLKEQYIKYSIELCNKFSRETKKKAFDSLIIL